MSIDYAGAGATKRRSWLSYVALPLIAFLAGLAAMGWVLVRWDEAARFIGVQPPPAQPVVAAPPQVQAAPAQSILPAASAPAAPDPQLMRRIQQLEQRVSYVQNQSQAAAGNADRAEGLLVAFAARRALDRGVPLGYIEGLLGQRFGDTQRAAVATVITASRQPVTLEELQEGLQEAGPSLAGAGPNQDWWTALKTEAAALITLRREGTPSTMPAERLRRATRRLEAGQVDVALAEVLRMPGRENARDWIAAARRYVAARRALDTLETAALLEPRAPAAAPTVPAAAAPAAAARPIP